MFDTLAPQPEVGLNSWKIAYPTAIQVLFICAPA